LATIFDQRIKSTLGRLRLRPISQIVVSIAFRIGQHAQKPWTGFPDDPAMPIEAAESISASLVFAQDLGNELTFGEINVIQFYVVVGDTDPEPQSLVHAEFHR
jgi:hypothetical protein